MRGEALLRKNLWSAPHFETVELASPIDWTIDPFNNRSWLWLFHQLAFTRDLLAFDAESNSTDGFNYAVAAFETWWDAQEDEILSTDVTWHDHGSARRAENILLLSAAIPADNISLKAWFSDMLELHAHFLADEKVYNTGTNHGLDQCIVLYRIAANLTERNWHQDFAELAASRIDFEVDTAFAPDGGHRENSPQYHHYGIIQLLKIRALRDDWADTSLPQIRSVDRRLNRAVGYFPHLLGPGGSIHQIGDTVVQPIQDLLKGSRLPGNYPHYRYAVTGGRRGRPPEATGLVLPESGWISLRNDWTDEAVHLLAHCGNVSDYHRHDDDGSFSLKAYGTDWVIDSGLYRYEETSPLRKFIRSHKAHSLSAPTGVKAIRKRRHNKRDSAIPNASLGETKSVVETISHMFPDFKMSRRFEFSTEDVNPSTVIKISDKGVATHPEQIERLENLSAERSTTFTTRFIIPMDKEIKINGGASTILLKGQTHTMRLHIEASFSSINVISAVEGGDPDGWRSVAFGTIEPSQIIEITYTEPQLAVDFTLDWID